MACLPKSFDDTASNELLPQGQKATGDVIACRAFSDCQALTNLRWPKVFLDQQLEDNSTMLGLQFGQRFMDEHGEFFGLGESGGVIDMAEQR